MSDKKRTCFCGEEIIKGKPCRCQRDNPQPAPDDRQAPRAACRSRGSSFDDTVAADTLDMALDQMSELEAEGGGWDYW